MGAYLALPVQDAQGYKASAFVRRSHAGSTAGMLRAGAGADREGHRGGGWSHAVWEGGDSEDIAAMRSARAAAAAAAAIGPVGVVAIRRNQRSAHIPF